MKSHAEFLSSIAGLTEDLTADLEPTVSQASSGDHAPPESVNALQWEIDTLAETLMKAAALAGAIEPLKVAQMVEGVADDVAGPAVARLTSLCVERPDPKGGKLWMLRATARRGALAEIAGERVAELSKAASFIEADRGDAFSAVFEAARQAETPESAAVPAKTQAALAALEFLQPSASASPDPSTVRMAVTERSLKGPISLNGNVLVRARTFRAFLSPGSTDRVMLLTGGSRDGRSRRLLDLRAALFGAPRRAVVMLDFRRALLADAAALRAEFALQLRQQAESSAELAAQADGVSDRRIIGDLAARIGDIIVLCDAYDAAGPVTRNAEVLRDLERAAPDAVWRYVLSVNEVPDDLGALVPDCVTDISRRNAPSAALRVIGATAQAWVNRRARS